MSILEKLQDHDWVTAAIQRGARQALIKHKAMGVPIAIWQDGEVILIPPEDIKIPDAPGDT